MAEKATPARGNHAGRSSTSRNLGPANNTPAPLTTSRTIGPVSDLERHLPNEWWRTLFNSVYLKTDGDVVENDVNTQRDVSMLIRVAALEPNSRVLDLCCGQGRHCLELARRGFRHVTGVDRSRYLIRLARRRAKQQNLNVTFHEGDARKFRLQPQHFHCVALMGNSFGYFDRVEDDLAVLRSVMRVLKPEATLVLDITDGDWMRSNFERRSWEWIDENHFVCRERSLSSDQQRLISREVVVHAERGVIADQFYAERLYNQQQIEELLDRAGFLNVRFHAPMASDSTRQQDLGMMAHRNFVTAEGPPKAAPAARRGPLFTNVTVLMGDPSMPDSVKRNGQFNPEDIDTINRLKRALDELSEYRFHYMDNHSTLLEDMRADPPSFVLNLCDEGYRNNAFLELHVPATLEMLNVPYTGAGPTCLGLCYNKALVRAIAQTLDIPVPAETYFDPGDQAATLPSAFPALVKPNFGDSSIGISADAVVHSSMELMNYLARLRDELPGRPLLVQEYLTGAEYTVGIIGNPGLTIRALPILEIDYSKLPENLPRILGYESKWHPDSPYWTDISCHEARIDEDTQRRLIDYSTLLFERLDCRDYARFDFRADSRGKIKLLEVNPNPGWCWDGKLNLMAGLGDLRYADLLRLIIEAAQERYAAARQAAGVSPAVAASPVATPEVAALGV
jgi:D-alanine-D-alanine ligase